jgi:signal transduction histidine kinase
VNATPASRWSDADVDDLVRANAELTELNRQLGATQDQLVQSEKMASIGQLAAGVAHEINNPIGFILSNIGTLDRYLGDLFKVLAAYEACEPCLGDARARQSLAQLRRDIELDYLKEDVPTLMTETLDGIERVRKIVQDLKDFSHVDANRDWEWADLHKGIDSTLNIVNNEIKYKAEVIKQYGALPLVRCLASELNQVFMNLLVNAAHAITRERGTIIVRTGSGDSKVWVEIEDDGCGIAQENLQRIFDPFFTTKPVGKGTGLGLSLAYGIVRKHGGIIDLTSEPGRGTCFRVTLPIERKQAEA